MTYTTPELLLVGAAQSLVLGDSIVYDGKSQSLCDDVLDTIMDFTLVDEDAW